MINHLLLIVIYVGLAKLFWNIVLIFLPFQTIEGDIESDFSFDRRVAFSEKFMSSSQIQPPRTPLSSERELKSIKLKVIFKKGSRSFILIEDKGKKIYINLKKNYKGYQLVKIENNFVVFERGKKLYKVQVEKEKEK